MDVTLPRKCVRSETLRERLGDTAYEKVFPARYLRRDASGTTVETPAELFRRVADYVGSAEANYGNDAAAWADRFEAMMTRLEFVPNSPTLMNAGTERPQLAACFVVSPADDLESIFRTVGEAARIFQSGGGVGYSFSALRPNGDRVASNGGVASGPVSFMRVFDVTCEQVRQGGRRRGAQMGVLRVDHPDVGRFCVAKRHEDAFANFNVSVGLTDEFYRMVRERGRHPLVNPRTGEQHVATAGTAAFYSTEYEDAPLDEVGRNFWRDYADDVADVEQYRGETDLTVGERASLPARFVWDLLVDSAWHTGEPGLFALDTANADHSFDVARYPGHRIDATNPCGEQPLENFEACTLGHVNLSLVVADGAPTWSAFRSDGGQRYVQRRDLASSVAAFLDRGIDWERLRRVVRDGTRFLDDVVTTTTFPLPEIERTVGRLRKVGLGVMGFAELLVQLGVRYGSDPSFEIARQVMAFVNRESTAASYELALERGAFPEWSTSKYATPMEYPDWFERHTGQRPGDWPGGFPLRNHSTTSIAPTGTTSIVGNTSGGCEPLFNVVYFRNVAQDVRGGEPLVDFDDYFFDVLDANGIDPDEIADEARELLAEDAFEGPASLSIPDAIADLFVTAGDVSAEAHVRMQAAFQQHVDAGISKTVNFPHSATRDDVDRAFHLALELGCKGVTVYRDRSRRVQVLTTRPGEPVGSAGRPQETQCCPI